MGLLDNFSLDNLDDPKKQALLAIGLGLLAPKQQKTSFLQDVGQSGLGGLQTYATARAQERANRQNELQQLVGSYKVLKDIDQQAYLQSQLPGGTPYQPMPGLSAMEARLGVLAGGKPMQTGLGASPQPTPLPAPSGGSGMPPQAPPQMPPPGMAPPSQSVMANPDYQPPMVRPPQPMPQAPQPQAPTADLPSMLQAANIPPQLASMMIRTGQQAKLYEMIGEALKPKNGPAGVTAIDPVTGQLKVLGGKAQPGEVPFTRDANGNLVASPVRGAAEEVARAEGLKTGAQKAAEAPYSFNSYNTGPGGAPQVMSVARLMQLEGNRGIPSGVPQLPPQGLPQVPGAPQVARVTPIPAPLGGPSGGLTGPNPVRVSADKAQQEDLAKYYAKSFIDTQEAGKSANKGLNNLDRIDQLMQDVETGKLTPTGMTIAAYAQSLGLPVDPKLPNKQAAEALTSSLALEMRNPSGGAGMPGSLSDNDLKFLRSMTPGLAQTTEGRHMIIETKRKLLQRDQEVAQLARDYMRGNGGQMDDGFLQKLSDYSQAHPLFPQAKTQETLPFQLPPGWKAERVGK